MPSYVSEDYGTVVDRGCHHRRRFKVDKLALRIGEASSEDMIQLS